MCHEAGQQVSGGIRGEGVGTAEWTNVGEKEENTRMLYGIGQHKRMETIEDCSKIELHTLLASGKKYLVYNAALWPWVKSAPSFCFLPS